MSAPVTQAEIQAQEAYLARRRAEMQVWDPKGEDRAADSIQLLLRAIAERDAEIEECMDEVQAQMGKSRDAREDLANYRASAEEQLRLHKEALRWALENGVEATKDSFGETDFRDSDNASRIPPVHLSQILMEAVRSDKT